jgi:hypothetical protein
MFYGFAQTTVGIDKKLWIVYDVRTMALSPA